MTESQYSTAEPERDTKKLDIRQEREVIYDAGRTYEQRFLSQPPSVPLEECSAYAHRQELADSPIRVYVISSGANVMAQVSCCHDLINIRD